MAGRIVVFGATGFNGRLVAEALVSRGARPLLAARSAERLDALAAGLGGNLETAVADVARPETVRALVERGDVLVSTVGPFRRYGEPAVQAAIGAGAHYLDSTGEGEFIRAVFDRHGPGAQAAGCGLLTAFGYDFVPGNLAGGLALREAGDAAARVDVGYYITGRASMSSGTRASAPGVALARSFAWRDGRLVDDRPARRLRDFTVRGRGRAAVSIGGSEHFGLPRVAPGLREVNVYLGWFGPFSRGLQGLSLAAQAPGVRPGLEALMSLVARGSGQGPGAEARAGSGSHVQAIAYDVGGRELAQAVLEGPNGYDLTGRFLAWGAERAAAGELHGTGALGPVDGFGLDALEAGCAEAGLRRVTPG
jgi:short subunit dehydrogenase-like uncharacterized protein